MCFATTVPTPKAYLGFTVTVTTNQCLQAIDNKFSLITEIIIETELAIEL
jgi:hypothetical protein